MGNDANEELHDFQLYNVDFPGGGYVPAMRCTKCGFWTQEMEVKSNIKWDFHEYKKGGSVDLSLNCKEAQVYRVMRE